MLRHALFAMSVCAVAFATNVAYAVTDFEPTNGPAGGWGGISTTFPFTEMDDTAANNGKVVIHTIKFLEVTAAAQGVDHVHTKAPTFLAHVHCESDIDTAKANNFWNWFFDTAGGKATQRSDATNKANCHSTALGRLGNGGKYDYWTQLGAAAAGYVADANPVQINATKTNIINDDLLYYFSQDHSTIVATSTTEEGGNRLLRWKNNASGIYECQVATLDTPGRTNVAAESGKAPTGTWANNAIGAEANLNPAGSVWRKK